MYISYQNGKIVGYTEQPQDLTLYNLERVEETDDKYVLCGNEYVLETSEKYIEYKKEQRKKEILNFLDELDLKSIRAIRANDTEYIEKYEEEAKALREELKKLN